MRTPSRCIAPIGPRLALAALLLTSAAGAAPAAGDGRAIMEQADRMNRPEWEMAEVRMELADRSGTVNVRELTWHFRNRDGERVSLLKFTAPANVEAVGLLVRERTGEPNAIWHYLPATRNVRRISAGHRQNRFMGTEFVFEDFEGLQLDRYRFELLGSEPCAGDRRCDLVEARASDAREAAESGYSKKVFWVDREARFLVKTELFDRDGKLAKVFAGEGFRPVRGHWRPTVQTMTNLADGRVTRLIEVSRRVGEPFDPHYLSQQYLRSE